MFLTILKNVILLPSSFFSSSSLGDDSTGGIAWFSKVLSPSSFWIEMFLKGSFFTDGGLLEFFSEESTFLSAVCDLLKLFGFLGLNSY